MDFLTNGPRTLQAATIYFSDPDNCVSAMVEIRWPDGVTCPHCGGKEHSYYTSTRLWRCTGCKKRFSLKVGTIMEDSPLGLDKWLCAMWLITNAKNGISSYEIHRALGITQKSAWFLLHRLRLAFGAGSLEAKLVGPIVEADESFIGGKEKNKHYTKRQHNGRGTVGKTIVMGILERGGKARTKVVPDTKTTTLDPVVRANVKRGAQVHTDAHSAYRNLSDEYKHEVVDHAIQYVRDNVHTNGLENFWSLLKRTISGTYVSVDPEHLFRYLEEQTFRFNERKDDDRGRFVSALGGYVGRRLTYKQLIGKV